MTILIEYFFVFVGDWIFVFHCGGYSDVEVLNNILSERALTESASSETKSQPADLRVVRTAGDQAGGADN